MNKRVEKALNEQIEKEASSSQFYLAMASWAEGQGLNGTAKFLYAHSDEERFHMLKLVKFVNERGGAAVIPGLSNPPTDFESLTRVFELLLEHELKVTESINDVVDVCLTGGATTFFGSSFLGSSFFAANGSLNFAAPNGLALGSSFFGSNFFTSLGSSFF